MERAAKLWASDTEPQQVKAYGAFASDLLRQVTAGGFDEGSVFCMCRRCLDAVCLLQFSISQRTLSVRSLRSSTSKQREMSQRQEVPLLTSRSFSRGNISQHSRLTPHEGVCYTQ